MLRNRLLLLRVPDSPQTPLAPAYEQHQIGRNKFCRESSPSRLRGSGALANRIFRTGPVPAPLQSARNHKAVRSRAGSAWAGWIWFHRFAPREIIWHSTSLLACQSLAPAPTNPLIVFRENMNL